MSPTPLPAPWKDATPDGMACSSPEELRARLARLELGAAEHYADNGELLDQHNNLAAAEWLLKLAKLSQARAQALGAPPRTSLDEVFAIDYFGEIHYLMRPWHVLNNARSNEQRLLALIEASAEAAGPAAANLAAEKRKHLAEVEAWLAQEPEPEADWDEDEDPPNLDSM